MKTVRTRFAPSPTGFLHIGGIRTALYNYLFAKNQGGVFILRLEDTDRERFVEAGVAQIVEGLEWVGLVPDEGFWINESSHKNVDYIQSERHKRGDYQKVANELIEGGLAYYSQASAETLAKLKAEAMKNHQPFIYRQSFEKTEPEATKGLPIRLNIEAIAKCLATKEVHWHDEIRGDFQDQLALIEDFIIIKSDGFPTYNFANVIDDHNMEISHVIRGDEFISSTAKHVLLYDVLGWDRPAFIHLPVINGDDGKKLSKRSGDTNVLDYKDKGYLPAALLNFLALLGWNDGSEQEIFSLEELQNKFSLARVNSSPAIFDVKRLDWMNGQHIRNLSIETLEKQAEPFWTDEAKNAKDSYRQAVLELTQERLKYFSELPELTSFFFTEPDKKTAQKLFQEPTDKLLKKLNQVEYKPMLEASLKALQDSSFTADDLSTKLNELLTALGTKPGVLFALIRIAITGSSFSPSIADTMAVLGKEVVIKRLEQAITLL